MPTKYPTDGPGTEGQGSVNDMDRILLEQSRAAHDLQDPVAVADYARVNGCTEKQARDGAYQGVYDWVMEEILERRFHGS